MRGFGDLVRSLTCDVGRFSSADNRRGRRGINAGVIVAGGFSGVCADPRNPRHVDGDLHSRRDDDQRGHCEHADQHERVGAVNHCRVFHS